MEHEDKAEFYLDRMFESLQHCDPGGFPHQGGFAQPCLYVTPCYSRGIFGRINPHCQQGQACHLQKKFKKKGERLIKTTWQSSAGVCSSSCGGELRFRTNAEQEGFIFGKVFYPCSVKVSRQKAEEAQGKHLVPSPKCVGLSRFSTGLSNEDKRATAARCCLPEFPSAQQKMKAELKMPR